MGEGVGGSASLWTRAETRLWTWTLFLGTMSVYSARVALPICAVEVGREYKWSKGDSGTVLSSFFWGYASTQALGGWLGDRYGGERVLATTTFFWSLLTFLTPPAFHAAYHSQSPITFLVLIRVAIGFTQGFHFPCMASLVSKRLTAAEKGRVFGLVTAGSHAGTVLAGSLGSLVLESLGWEWVFYASGLSGLLWWLWLRGLAQASRLRQSLSSASAESLLPDLVAEAGVEKTKKSPSERQRRGQQSSPVPWRRLFSHPSFWAAFVAHYCGANAYFTLFSWLPSYFTENFPSAKGWVFNVVPNLAIVSTALTSPLAASWLLQRGWSLTSVRRAMEGGSQAGMALCLFAVASIQSYEAALFFLALALALRGLHHAGVNVNPGDFAPNHTGAVFGVMNLASAVPGFVGVYVAGHILNLSHSWPWVFSITGLQCLCGLLVYALAGTAKQII